MYITYIETHFHNSSELYARKKIVFAFIPLTFSTEFAYSMITLTRTLVSAKNLSIKGSSAQITRTANPGPK